MTSTSAVSNPMAEKSKSMSSSLRKASSCRSRLLVSGREFGQAIVGDDEGALFPLAEMTEPDHRHHSHSEQSRRCDSGVTGQDAVVVVDQARYDKADLSMFLAILVICFWPCCREFHAFSLSDMSGTYSICSRGELLTVGNRTRCRSSNELLATWKYAAGAKRAAVRGNCPEERSLSIHNQKIGWVTEGHAARQLLPPLARLNCLFAMSEESQCSTRRALVLRGVARCWFSLERHSIAIVRMRTFGIKNMHRRRSCSRVNWPHRGGVDCPG